MLKNANTPLKELVKEFRKKGCAPNIMGATLPKIEKEVNFENERNYKNEFTLNCDKVEFTALKKENFLRQTSKKFFHYVKKNGLVVVQIMHCNQLVDVARVAQLKGINQDDLLKITMENFFCYQCNKSDFIIEMAAYLGVEFKSYTRIDIALDFQKMACGNPIQFMQAVRNDLIVVKGGKGVVNYEEIPLTREYLQIKHFKRHRKITGMQIGSLASGCSIVMYNKTKEMNSKTFKPWIAAQWEKAGFDNDLDTFRLEFQTTKAMKVNTIVNKQGQLIIVNFNDIRQVDDTLQHFIFCYNRHLNFAKNEDGKRFSRLETVELFNIEKEPNQVVKPLDALPSNNYVKAYIKMSCKKIFYTENALNNNVVPDYEAGQMLELIVSCNNIVNELIQVHNLQNWYNKKMAEPTFLN